MRSPLRARMGRTLAAVGLTAALLVPAAAPAAAQDTVIFRVGTTQSMDSVNPYGTALVVGYEAFGLTYDLLVGFGDEIEPVPGFAETWTRAADGQSWEFKIREGMLWSDGEPATAQDACFSLQINLDAIDARNAGDDSAYVGLGYIDPGVADAGITAVECPDDTTMIVTTADPSDRPLQLYVPILPQHIWGEMDFLAIGEDTFDPPQVGTGPYVLEEWRTGEFTRFVRNENYWGTQGAADEVIIQEFGDAGVMVQALIAGEIDYAAGVNADQFDQLATTEGITTVAGAANGWTQLGFNTYGTGTGNTIEGGGPSTPALLDPLFRDALGYAIDKDELLDRLLGGYGDVGTTNVPPALPQWHVPPAEPRTFDLTEAASRLEAAGYVTDASGARLDKDGNPISLDLVMPDSDDSYPDAAEFIKTWWAEVGVTVNYQVIDEGTLIDLMLPPEAGGEANLADYDLFIWGWAGSPDPNALLQIFRCDAIGSSSDSNWCNPEFDALYDEQLALGGDERKAVLTQMQELFYEEAPYHILYYDANLHAYRTDRFEGWRNQPSNGTPIFSYGTLGYTLLTPVSETSPEPSVAPTDGSSAAPTPAPSGDGSGDDGATDTTPILIGILALAAVVVVGLVVARRRGADKEDE